MLGKKAAEGAARLELGEEAGELGFALCCCLGPEAVWCLGEPRKGRRCPTHMAIHFCSVSRR